MSSGFQKIPEFFFLDSVNGQSVVATLHPPGFHKTLEFYAPKQSHIIRPLGGEYESVYGYEFNMT